MEHDRAEIGRPRDRGDLGHAQLVGVTPGREGDPCRLEPFGVVRWRPLLVDRLALDAVGEPLHRARPLEQRLHDAGPYRDVVVDQVKLGLAMRREVDLVGVGDAHGASLDLELDRRGRSHEKTLPPVSGS